jgi:phosphoglycolate phosphatase
LLDDIVKRILFWDIDGTLITTGRAGIIAWELAAEETFGQRPDFSQLRTAGLTDTEIAARIAALLGPSSASDLPDSLLRRYEAHLPEALPKRNGHVMPGVIDILEACLGRIDVISVLLTGNTRAGASAKLAHYGLARYFTDGAFADGCADRLTIAYNALKLSADHRNASQRVVIGDTPHDIRCGRHIGALTIAVATGEYDENELRQHEPSLVLPRLPCAVEFFDLLDSRLA